MTPICLCQVVPPSLGGPWRMQWFLMGKAQEWIKCFRVILTLTKLVWMVLQHPPHSFLKVLQIPISATTGSPVPTMKTEMTIEDSYEIFSKTKETTASSPSGINYGHYIAACESPELAVVNTILMVTPFKTGTPLTRWTNSLHCMIKN